MPGAGFIRKAAAAKLPYRPPARDKVLDKVIC